MLIVPLTRAVPARAECAVKSRGTRLRTAKADTRDVQSREQLRGQGRRRAEIKIGPSWATAAAACNLPATEGRLGEPTK